MSAATTAKKILIVGLGNPGKKYEFTRHNLGFRVLDRLKTDLGLPNFAYSKSFEAEVSESFIDGKQIILLLPQTFMNLAGQSVVAAKKKYGLRPSQVWVVHDDKDLDLGDLREKKGGSSAGHKGVDSIAELLGSKNFRRYRLGIWADSGTDVETDKFVLSKFLPEEEPMVRNFIDKAASQIIEDLDITR